VSSLLEIVAALADALEPLRDEIPDLQIHPYWLANPTPPAIDIYPGDPFSHGTGFGIGHDVCFFTVRARVTTADQQAGQEGLLALMDTNSSTSVEAALISDQTLGGVVGSLAVGEQDTPGVSGYRVYVEDAASNGRLLGAEWRVEVLT
jgi:hypothetical protein